MKTGGAHGSCKDREERGGKHEAVRTKRMTVEVELRKHEDVAVMPHANDDHMANLWGTAKPVGKGAV